MSQETIRMRVNIRGESIEDHLKRQHEIDKYQINKPNPMQVWSIDNGWGDSYDIDEDEIEEEKIIHQLEQEVWDYDRKSKRGIITGDYSMIEDVEL